MSEDEQEISAEVTSGESEPEVAGDEVDVTETDSEGEDATRAAGEVVQGDPPASEASVGDDAASKYPSLWPAALKKSPWWMVAAQIVLAPLLAAGAIGVHWWLNVPNKIIESPNDQGAKKPKAKQNKQRRGRRDRDQKARSDRSPDELQRDWDRYAQAPFDDEPVRPVWARRHQALINRAVVVARREAFRGAPEQPRVVLSGTKCHTVRCRFTLRSQYLHALDAVSDALSRLRSGDADVWRTFDIEPRKSPEDEGEDEGEREARGDGKALARGDDEDYIDIIVSFQTDDTDSRGLSIGPDPESDEAAEGKASEDEAAEDETPESDEAAEGKAPAP